MDRRLPTAPALALFFVLSMTFTPSSAWTQDAGRPSEDAGAADKEEQTEKSDQESEASENDEKPRVKSKTIMGEIGAIKKGDGSVEDALEDGAAETSMDEAFENSEGVKEQDSETTEDGGNDSSKSSEESASAAETAGQKEGGIEVEVRLEAVDTAGTGSLDEEDVRQTLERYRDRFVACAERARMADPEASGKVVIIFTIGRNGKTSDSKPTADSVGSRAGSCKASLIDKMPFPKPKGGDVMVNATFKVE